MFESAASASAQSTTHLPGLGERSLLFIHIPKTGGVSMSKLLARHFQSGTTLELGLDDEPVAEGSFTAADRYRYVHGHVPYAAIERFRHRPFAFTLLRDPVQRALSAFRHLRRDAPRMQKLAEAGVISAERVRDYAAAGEMSISEFLRHEPRGAERHLGNLQVEFMARRHIERQYAADAPHEIRVSVREAAVAMGRLRSLDAFGLTEQMQESADVLAHALGVATLGEPGTLNVSPEGRGELISADAFDALCEFTCHDRQLYALGAELFADRLSTLTTSSAWNNTASTRATSFTAGLSVPGPGWYEAEYSGRRWCNWTGPGAESSVILGAPPDGTCVLRVSVVHAVCAESLHELKLRVNGTDLVSQVVQTEMGYDILAAVPATLLRRDRQGNRVTLYGFRLRRPCDLDPSNRDARLLGIAVHRVAFDPH